MPVTKTPQFSDKFQVASDDPTTGGGNLTAISAHEMQRLAEKASGLRTLDPVLVIDTSGNVDVVPQKEKRDDQTALLKLVTSGSGPGLTRNPRIELVLDDVVVGKGSELDQADAVFTSQSAVEKFVLPYYSHFKSPQEVEQIANTLFSNPLVIAGHHLPGSGYGVVKAVTLHPETKKFHFVRLD
jgi:hypothetical protein